MQPKAMYVIGIYFCDVFDYSWMGTMLACNIGWTIFALSTQKNRHPP